MKNNTIKLFGITAAAVLLTTGCGKVPKLENGQDAVVSFKDSKISVDTLYNEMKEKYALNALINLIDTEILEKEYKDDKEIDKKVNSQVELMKTQYGKGDESKLLEFMSTYYGITSIDELKTTLRISYLRENAVTDYAKSIVTDKEIEKVYEEDIFGDISAKHILISPEVDSNATDAEKTAAEEAALKKAKEVIEKLNKGEDWDKLAKEYSSDDSNKDKGGKLNDFVHGDMVAEFEKAAKELEKGKYTTTPVKTQYGYHIIYKVDQKEKPELKTVKDDIIDEIANDKINSDSTIQTVALEKIREKYGMKIEDDSLKGQYERYLTNAKKSTNEE